MIGHYGIVFIEQNLNLLYLGYVLEKGEEYMNKNRIMAIATIALGFAAFVIPTAVRSILGLL